MLPEAFGSGSFSIWSLEPDLVPKYAGQSSVISWISSTLMPPITIMSSRGVYDSFAVPDSGCMGASGMGGFFSGNCGVSSIGELTANELADNFFGLGRLLRRALKFIEASVEE